MYHPSFAGGSPPGGGMDYPIRSITREEAPAFFRANAAGFSRTYNEEGLAHTYEYGEFDRSTAVWDGDQIVSTTGTWSFEMSVPGGVVPCAGTTWVSVRPTHRRRGILTAMMRHHLDAARDRGEYIASLWASEVPIYGRFGYGIAAEGTNWHIDHTRTALKYAAPAPGRARYVEREDALRDWPALYNRIHASRPGFHSRHAAWWDHRLFRLPETPPSGHTNKFYVQYEEAGEVLGYVSYRVKQGDHEGSSSAELHVVELQAATDSAYTALWQFVFGVDLIATIHAEWRPVDEPLYWMLNDPRRLVRHTTDTIFVRMLDVPRALAARRYSVEGEIVIEVSDTFIPSNSGRYLLQGGPDAAHCAPTDRAADVSMSEVELGSLYLGGVSAHPLVRAGRIRGSHESIVRLESMFRWHTAPWAPEIW